MDNHETWYRSPLRLATRERPPGSQARRRCPKPGHLGAQVTGVPGWVPGLQVAGCLLTCVHTYKYDIPLYAR